MRARIAHRRPAPSRHLHRHGGATVEFALVAPLFITLVLGSIEIGNAVEATNKLTAAVREGGRLASMDATTVVTGTQTANEKVIQDVRNFITANGMPGDAVTVSITYADGDGEDVFDLADASNHLQMFRIRASVAYADISLFPIRFMTGANIESSMVYRMGRVQMVE